MTGRLINIPPFFGISSRQTIVTTPLAAVRLASHVSREYLILYLWFDGRRTRRRHDDVRTSNSLTTSDDDAYKTGAWTGRRLAAGALRQHPSVDAHQRPPSVEFPAQHQQHRDSNEYASIWEPWPPTMSDNQDSVRRTGTIGHRVSPRIPILRAEYSKSVSAVENQSAGQKSCYRPLR